MPAPVCSRTSSLLPFYAIQLPIVLFHWLPVYDCSRAKFRVPFSRMLRHMKWHFPYPVSALIGAHPRLPFAAAHCDVLTSHKFRGLVGDGVKRLVEWFMRSDTRSHGVTANGSVFILLGFVRATGEDQWPECRL